MNSLWVPVGMVMGAPRNSLWGSVKRGMGIRSNSLWGSVAIAVVLAVAMAYGVGV